LNYPFKLSKQNCDTIFGVVDIKKLADVDFTNEIGEGPTTNTDINSMIRKSHLNGAEFGFNKAMDLNKDKLFTLEDMKAIFAFGHVIGMNNILAIQSQHSPQPLPKPDSDKLRDEVIQSLQQPTEIQVELEMEKYGYCEGCTKSGLWHCAHADTCGNAVELEKPKLDENDCVILKKK
jgi:hypothetical protein